MEAQPQGDTMVRLNAGLRNAFRRQKDGVSTYRGPSLLLSALPRVEITKGAVIDFNVFPGQFAHPKNVADANVNGGRYARHARIACSAGAGGAAWVAQVRPAGVELKDGIKVEIVPRTS